MGFKMQAVPGSEVLAYLMGLFELNPDFAKPQVMPFRTALLGGVAGAGVQTLDTDTGKVPSTFDFLVEGFIASCDPLVADTHDIARDIFIQFNEDGRGYDMLGARPIPLSLMQAVFGGTGGAGLVMPTKSFSYQMKFKVPYVAAAGSLITAIFTANAALGAAAHIVDAALLGTFIRKGLQIGEE